MSEEGERMSQSFSHSLLIRLSPGKGGEPIRGGGSSDRTDEQTFLKFSRKGEEG